MFSLKVSVKFRAFGVDFAHIQHVWNIPVPFPVDTPVTFVNFTEDGVTITAGVTPAGS